MITSGVVRGGVSCPRERGDVQLKVASPLAKFRFSWRVVPGVVVVPDRITEITGRFRHQLGGALVELRDLVAR
jgi:hypothetical protein